MISWLLKFSLNYRYAVILCSAITLFIGIWCASKMSIDVFPNLNRPTVVLLAESHELTPEQTALQIALPIERSMAGIPGVERISSQTGKGMTVIKIEFGWGSDIYRNRQIVNEKLSEVKDQIRVDELNLSMTPISSIMGQIQLIGLSSKDKKISLQEIRQLAETRLKYDLSSLPGVAKVIVVGGSPKQLSVAIDEQKLRDFELTLEDVRNGIEKANLNSSGGIINLREYAPIVSVNGMITNSTDLENAFIKEINGRPVRLKDVAQVGFGPAQMKTGDAGINGQEGVILVIMKQPDADTISISNRIAEKIASIRDSLPQDLLINQELFSQKLFIERSLNNLIGAIRDGAIMVVLILFIFLMNWRTTLITLCAIPLSVAITAIIFELTGWSINTMTLGGLAVGVGSLVDSAIVDVENCYRRLRENKRKPEMLQEAPLDIVFKASYEVRGAVMMSTFLVMIVYIPLFFLSGMEGKMFIPIGVSYMVSMAASLFVALTVTVSLCAVLLPNHLGKNVHQDPWFITCLKKFVAKIIPFCTKHNLAVVMGFVVLSAGSIGLLLTRGTQFLPEFNEGVAQINLVLPPSTSLEMSNNIASQAERYLMAIPGIKNLSRRTGRAEEDEHAHGVNASDIIVSFDDSISKTREEIIGEIRKTLSYHFPGVLVAVEQPLSHLMSAMLSGVKAQVAIKIYGTDFPQMYELAKETESLIADIPGVTDLQIDQQQLVPFIEVRPNREKLAANLLTIEDVGSVVRDSLGEDAITYFYEGINVYPVVLRLKAEQRQSLQSIESLYLRNSQNELIQLRDVADVLWSATINAINHENNERLISVHHNIAGRPLSDVVKDVEKAILPIQQKMKSLPNYHLKISGQYEAQQSASQQMLILSFGSLILMILLLYWHFKSMSLVIQTLFSIPMSLIGASLFVTLTNQIVSISTLVGLIAMIGVASSNAILLLDSYRNLTKNEGMSVGIPMLVKAGQDRMTPILMTALTSGIALIPLIIAPGTPGKEILYPVASVMIGGLLTCTIFDFTVRPALFWMIYNKKN